MLDLSLQQLLRILTARYKLALAIMTATVAGTIVGCLLWPAQYTATTTVVVDTKSPDPIATALSSTSSGGSQNYTLSLGTEADIITSDRVARRAVKILKLEENKTLQKRWREEADGKGTLDGWIAELILKKLSVKTSTTSNVVPIKFIGADPEFAALVANAVAQAYIDVNLALKVDPAKHNSIWFAGQEKILRESLERAQAAMSRFQQEKGIVATSEQQDLETSVLSDIEKQLSSALGASSDALSKKNAGDAVIELPDLVNNNKLNTIRTDLARHEAKLQETAGNLGENHPQYQRMVSEIEAIKENLRIETRNVIGTFDASMAASDRKVAQLRVAYEKQKDKVLHIKSDRDQLALLQSDVETAKKALIAIDGRQQQADLFSQATQTQVAILTPAVAPFEPSAPKTLVYTLMSIPLGILLGAVAALALEQYDLRIRCAEDLAEMLQAPVLGSIARPRAPGRRFPFLRRPPAMAAT
jgi:chain length determinant protein EpsF